MMRLALPILLSLAAVTKAYFPLDPLQFYSAASDAQIRFALENKYDDTGPGAKEPEYAYKTYSSLEEALLGYLDDPDTKLPDHEKDRALSSLPKPGYIGEYKPFVDKGFKRYYPKSVEEYTGYNQQKQEKQGLEELSKPKPVQVYKGYRLPQAQVVLTKLRTNPPKKYHFQSRPLQNNGYLKPLEEDKEIAEPYIIEKIKQPFRGSSHGLRNFNRDPDLQNARDQYDTHPKYTFSYGVHVPDTGDTKSAQETREGGTVRGYYSFMDPDGKLRTVHYTADDKQGFQATVERE